jgi:hypothetical protein
MRFKWVALSVGVLFFVCAPKVGAVESGGVGGKPARPDPSNPRTESIFIFEVDAGQTAKNAVKVYNNSDTEKTINVYAVDSQVSSGGAFACAQKVDEPNAVGEWIDLTNDQVTLPPGGSLEIPFTLAVPKNTAGGEHNGCIVIQEANQTPRPAGNGIALSFRSAIRVAVTVKGTIKKGLSFTRLESRKDKDDKRIVTASLKNTGNVSLDTDVDVRIKTLLGTTVRQSGGQFPILPGGESEFNLETKEPYWGGMYLLAAKAIYNPDPAAGIGKNNQNASITKTKLLVTAPKPPAAAVELGVVVLAATSIALFLRRRRLGRHWRRHAKNYLVKEGENLQQIAERFGLAWKTIARVNHLKPPYHLKAGDRLRILPPSLDPKRHRKSSHKTRR